VIRSLLDGAPTQAQRADVCIVGAGAAGIILAVELLKKGKSVLLLEGGGEEVEESSQDPYKSEIVGLKHDGVHIGRFRAMGGSTTRWGGQILELDDRDFQQRDGVEGSGWPIQKSELTPYYARAIELEGLSHATLQDEDVWRQINLAPPSFDAFDVVFSRWCPEPNFARLYADTLKSHPALTVWLHANAVEMKWEGSRFRSVRCKSLSGIEGTFFADQFIFSLGGIESSRFFLQPSAAAGPWNRSGLLGRYFQDHVVCGVATIEVHNPAALHRAFDNVVSRGLKYQPKIHLKPEIQQSSGTLNVAASISFVSEFDEALGRLKATARRLLNGRWRENSFDDVLHALRYSPLLARQVLRYRMHQRVYNPPDAIIGLLVQCEQEPESKSRISLSDTRDSLGMFRTRLDWRISDREVYSMRTLVEHATKSLAGIGRVIPDPGLMSLDPSFKERCGDNYHHMGGMRLSVSPDDGLVDTNLRIHGMDNGYICSSAVFPTSGYSNPTHTLLALAVRLADHLK
jgi:choline dehydrogenase-like flavoprotein